ncbi:anaerobic ribonucleoside-triphosphate reductase activating protein [Sulfuricystis multivorans]|uniref:anaerobic ribonucleoside-triphosphate reductase activating protein n=1 Tax=Sulfuricystis multivorans TaxID=2211108 RepID=UPI000F8346AD|nr:anaerobic ribonucleoside-triphosphate reductase activating protein [Sulfuricystis multivorans]
MPEPTLAVGGLVPFTTIDFPGRLAAVVFCQGCPWRCTYCHNPHLLPRGPGALAWPDVFGWLASRRGLLDGVVFSGGEPLLQRDLPAALTEVRALGFATALHTAGAYPERLAAALPLLDWVGFDVKAPFAEYAPIVGCAAGCAARQSLELLLASGVPHEIRCTVPPQLDEATLGRMAAELAGFGVAHFTQQVCRPATLPMKHPE